MSAASHPSPRAAPSSSSPPQDAAIPAPHASDRAPPAPAAESAGDPARRPTFDGAEDGIGGGGARGRRSAWNISSNGLSEVGAVMGAVSWPALSESARASPKLSSSDSLKSLSDGSISAPPGPAITPPPPKQNMNNPNPSSTPTPASTSLQKQNPNHSNPIGRGGGGGGGGNLANGGSPPPPPLPPPPHPQPTMEETSQQSTRNFRNRSNNSSDHGPRGGGGSTIYPHGGADNHHSRGNRRGHNGGGGGFGNRRNYGYRDAQQMPPSQLQHGPPPPFLRPPPPPPPPPPPFMGFPPQVRPFISPMGFHEIHSPMYYIPPYPPFESYKNIGYVAHQVPPVMGPTMVVTPEDHQHALMKQIEYYFSSENLCRDLYLRQKMDDHGWVPISLIANFNRVKQLATNLSYILDTVRGSDMLEVEGEKIRRRNDWMNWILPPSSNPYGSTSGSQSPTPSNYDLAGHLQSVGLEEGARNTNSSTNQVLTGVSSRGSTRRNINSGPNVGESN